MKPEKQLEKVVKHKCSDVLVRIHGVEKLTQERRAQAFARLIVAEAEQAR